MMNGVIRIIIDQEIPSQNQRDKWHWRVRHQERKRWTDCFMFNKRRGEDADHDGVREKRDVTIIAYRRQRCRDIANLVGGAKGLIDGLVQAKLLIDDSQAWAKFEYHQDVASKGPSGQPCTVILIRKADS